MAFCKYCGTQLADGQLCSCEKAQAARQAAASQAVLPQQVQQTAPNPQFQQTQQAAPNQQFQQTQQAAPNQQFQQTQQAAPNQQFEQARQTATQAQATVVNATRDVKPFLQTYFANPEQAIRTVMQKDNLSMAITMTVIRVLAMSLAIFGVFHSVCKFIQKTATQNMGGFSLDNLGAGVSISAPFIESFLYGILIAVIGMALFVLLLFIMVKIQKGNTSIRAIYEASACNGVLTSLLLLLTFVFSFMSLKITVAFVVLSLLSWIICGVLTAQIVCPKNNNGLFWIMYFLGVAIIFVIGFKVFPSLLLKAVGGISISAYGQSMKLKDVMGNINLSNITDALDELMDIF